MENPYESPTSQLQSRESIRTLWRRRFVCPYCGESQITMRSVYLRYPGIKIRCPACSGRLAIKLGKVAMWKYIVVGNVLPVSIALSVLACYLWMDPFELFENALFKWFGRIWIPFGRAYGFRAQKIVVAGLLFVISVVPLLLMIPLVLRLGLRTLALHSTLLRADGHVPEPPAQSGTR